MQSIPFYGMMQIQFIQPYNMLYYSGHPRHGKASIGLAISDDGISFTKADSNPGISRAIAPEAVIHNGILYLFYQRDDAGFFEVYCCTSEDGYSFNLDRGKKVFRPSSGDDFDSFSISTVRIWKDEDFFYRLQPPQPEQL